MNHARHLRSAPTTVDVLRDDIRTICTQIDVRLRNRPGTAERGIYFWLWPPDDITAEDVLTRLRLDAVNTLWEIANLTNEGTPE